MNDIRNKYVPPAINETAFNCPHCGALAKQFWYAVLADRFANDRIPLIIDEEEIDTRLGRLEDAKDAVEWKKARILLLRIAAGLPFLHGKSRYGDCEVPNLSISSCFNCNNIAIWIYDRLLWPRPGAGPLPNPDLPDHIRADYDEASAILDLSPRGAAALLRLCVQKLCQHLNEPGKDLNEPGKDLNAGIAELVQKGLDDRVKRSLDVVRVIGNNAVHPGQIDLKDDRAIAEKLFGLVNLITERMISEEKHVEAMYKSLPEGARKAIEKRDGKK